MKTNTILLVLLIFVASFFGIYLVMDSIKDDQTETVVTEYQDVIESETSNNDDYQLNVSVGEPIANTKTQTYDININIDNLPLGAIATYYICGQTDTIAKNDNGEFRNIPGNSNGSYNILIKWINADGNYGIPFTTSISGFTIIEKPKMDKMTASTLEALVNSQSKNLYNSRAISKNVRFEFTNIKEDERCPENMATLFNKFKFGLWSSIKVIAVEYNDNNQISEIIFSIVY